MSTTTKPNPTPALLKHHPGADIFPMMDEASYAALREDIREHGQRIGIDVIDDLIVDGRNRYKACIELGIEPYIRLFEGDDPLAYILSMNLHRRQLSTSQRATCAARLHWMTVKPRRGKAKCNSTLTVEQIAAQFGVSRKLIFDAAEVLRDGCDLLIEAVDRGDIRVSLAKDFVRIERNKSQQALFVDVGHVAKLVAATKSDEQRQSKTNQPAELTDTIDQQAIESVSEPMRGEAARLLAEDADVRHEVYYGDRTLEQIVEQRQAAEQDAMVDECPRGGSHRWGDDDCELCHEPRPEVIPMADQNDVVVPEEPGESAGPGGDVEVPPTAKAATGADGILSLEEIQDIAEGTILHIKLLAKHMDAVSDVKGCKAKAAGTAKALREMPRFIRDAEIVAQTAHEKLAKADGQSPQPQGSGGGRP